jgi:hypothetical protein
MACRLANSQAFARKDLLVLVVVVFLLASLAWLEFGNARVRSWTLCCNCNLKQIGLAFRTWELDHTNRYPMGLSTNLGGTREYLAFGETFRHFVVMSNELSTPRILVCPSDWRRSAASFTNALANTNVSYFVGFLDNSENPQMLLSGDRDLTNGAPRSGNSIGLTDANPTGWASRLHRGLGNIALSDGSVQTFHTADLRQMIKWNATVTNRLSLP